MSKDRLVTPAYCYILAANFLLYFGFYLLMPVLPFYLSEIFGADHSRIGIVLSVYTIAALAIRPFSGFLLDTLARKPLYLLAYFIFTALFAGYMIAGTLTMFTMFRIMHGLAFGTVSVAGNTLVIDVTPSSRRGEGLGYYGLANNIAMAVGPMVGLFLHDYSTFDTVFTMALCACSIGFLSAVLVRVPRREPVPSEPISLDRFILIKGLLPGLGLLLLSIPYGMTTTYMAMYAKEIGITHSSGLFFTVMAVGLSISRMFSGRQVDKGRITKVISYGMYIACIGLFLVWACEMLMAWEPVSAVSVFYGTALLLGIGFGTMFPAFNTLFVNLAPNNKRGTATSTYLTSWDVGVGVGLMLGGHIAHVAGGFATAYFVGACLTVVSLIYFKFVIVPHFNKYKVR